MNKVKHIFYKSYDPFYNRQWYHLDVEKKKEIYIKMKGKKIDKKEHNLDEMELFYKVMRLENILDGWEDYYIDNNVLDGVKYKIGIKYADNTCRIIEGKNKFPENFIVFNQLIGV